MTLDPHLKTILLVDDDHMSIEMLATILEANYNLLKAQSGSEALALLATVQPDLFMVDIVMPEMDGYELYSRIKELPDQADTPLIFVTSMSEHESESRGLELGAVDYIAKPYNPQLVRLRVRNHLLLKARLDQLILEISERKKTDDDILTLKLFT